MFDFLPHSEKVKLQGEYKLRVWASLLILWSTVVLITMFLVVPLVVILTVNEKNLQTEITRLDEAQEVSTITLSGAIGGIDFAANQLGASRVETFFNTVEVAGPEIPLTNFAFRETVTPEGEQLFEVSFSGRAETRQDLVDLQDRLDDSAVFVNTNLPVSLFAQERDIEFTVSANYIFQ